MQGKKPKPTGSYNVKGKRSFPGKNPPLSVGVRGDHVLKYMNDADLIFAVGQAYLQDVSDTVYQTPRTKKIIQCNIDE
ncbi:MAG: hypothetical protein Ct9H300mP19_11480 [Dehalococcoidia bacterium]|nr:MAG: hypothetical protein Ct9H300mP19_11480 [Dehalococcoidia bacterium]